MTSSIRTTAIFLQPFQLSGLNETLPPGEYEIETLQPFRRDQMQADNWTSSVLVQLHPRASHPGLDRTLTVPLADLERAEARDKLTGKALTDYVLEEMLADPMIRLVMQADGVTVSEMRDLYAPQPKDHRDPGRGTVSGAEGRYPLAARNVPGPRTGSPRPGIGE